MGRAPAEGRRAPGALVVPSPAVPVLAHCSPPQLPPAAAPTHPTRLHLPHPRPPRAPRRPCRPHPRAVRPSATLADAHVELTVKILGQGDVAVRVPLQARAEGVCEKEPMRGWSQGGHTELGRSRACLLVPLLLPRAALRRPRLCRRLQGRVRGGGRRPQAHQGRQARGHGAACTLGAHAVRRR